MNKKSFLFIYLCKVFSSKVNNFDNYSLNNNVSRLYVILHHLKK